MPSSALKSLRVSQLASWIGFGLVVGASFHTVSSLLLAVLGVAPGSENWPLLLTLAGVLAISGSAVGVQSYFYDYLRKAPRHKQYYAVFGTVSGAASGAVLGFFVGAQLGDQMGNQKSWAIASLAIGSILLAAIAKRAYRQAFDQQSPGKRRLGWSKFLGSAIAASSGLCAYAIAFGLGAWTLMALSVGRVELAALLSLPTLLFLWCTRRAMGLSIVLLIL